MLDVVNVPEARRKLAGDAIPGSGRSNCARPEGTPDQASSSVPSGRLGLVRRVPGIASPANFRRASGTEKLSTFFNLLRLRNIIE
jgi:hypothetical protein